LFPHLGQDVVDRLVDLGRRLRDVALRYRRSRGIDDRFGLCIRGRLRPRSLGTRLRGVGLRRIDLGLERLLRALRAAALSTASLTLRSAASRSSCTSFGSTPAGAAL